MLDDATACSITKIVLNKYRRRICLYRNIPLHEFFNSCFIACKQAETEKLGLVHAKFMIVSIGMNDTRPGSRSSRKTKEQKENRRDLPCIQTDQAELNALKVDLEKAFSLLSREESVLFDLRFSNDLTQVQASELLNLTLKQEQTKEHKMLGKLKKALKDWR